VTTGDPGATGSAVSHPRLPPRRGARVRTWWGKAWQRAVEEASYAEADLRLGRALARGGEVGSLTVGAGSLVAAVHEGGDGWTVTGELPVLDDDGRATLLELVRSGSGRVAALLARELPIELVEQCEEAGVELLPDGGELATTCSCRAWLDPCPHALAVLTQLGWLVDADPLVLLALRGVPRDDLAAVGRPPCGLDDVEVALDAALRAARALAVLEAGGDPVHLL
jgi:uncharacterized Zn finger protein